MRDPMWTAIERLERELRAAREHVERLERERNTAQEQAEWQLRAWTALRDNLDISSDKAEVIVRLTRERDKYRALFDDILAFARDYVSEESGERRRRVRYWSALALLRCVSSSPAAAAATLRSRAAVDQASDEELDEVGRRTVGDAGTARVALS